MKALLMSISREFKLIFRNGITIFMVAAPAILALVFILVFGAVNESALQLAVDSSVPDSAVAKLARVADVQRVAEFSELESRVRETDAIAGVIMQDGTARILIEGNEGAAYRDATVAIVSLALGAADESTPYHSEALAAKGTLAYTISMISALLLSLFIGGATVGLSIVDEREGGAIRAVSVSPMRLSGFLASKLIPALLLGLFGMAAAALIMGRAALVPQYLLLTLMSLLVSGMMMLAIGAFAGNQVAAIGVLKLLMPLSMVLPITAIFVPKAWQVAYYLLPMYWQYRALDAILTGSPAGWFTLLTLLVSVPWFAATLWMFTKKTNFRKAR